MSRFFALFVMAAAVPVWAGEFAIFTSGARLRADRHEIQGDTVLLYQGSGISEVPLSAIADFETFEDAPGEAPAAPKPAATQAAVAPAPAPLPVSPQDMIRGAALRQGLPPEFVASVAKVESAFKTNAVSPKGAIGVMQLMPGTAKALGANPNDVRENIDAGTRLLRDLLVKYDGDVVKALAAYNAGSGAVDRYNGLPPYDETRRYVNKVIGAYQQQQAQGDESSAPDKGAIPSFIQ
jgi:soluble lytic murein transglycosylase-like protein